LSHGACSCILMYINAVADCVILYLQHDFYNTIFKIKQIICSFRVSPPPPAPRRKNSGCAPDCAVSLLTGVCQLSDKDLLSVCILRSNFVSREDGGSTFLRDIVVSTYQNTYYLNNTPTCRHKLTTCETLHLFDEIKLIFL
jgi:hypothetical protein